MLDTPATFSTREIFPALNAVQLNYIDLRDRVMILGFLNLKLQMGEELERMHPRIYSNVSRQLSRAAFGELQVTILTFY